MSKTANLTPALITRFDALKKSKKGIRTWLENTDDYSDSVIDSLISQYDDLKKSKKVVNSVATTKTTLNRGCCAVQVPSPKSTDATTTSVKVNGKSITDKELVKELTSAFDGVKTLLSTLNAQTWVKALYNDIEASVANGEDTSDLETLVTKYFESALMTGYDFGHREATKPVTASAVPNTTSKSVKLSIVDLIRR